jgi:hypothetical protein
LSAAVHAGLLFAWIYLSQTDGCRADIGEGDGTGYRNVGLVERSSDSEEAASSNSAEVNDAATADAAAATASESTDADQLVAEALSLPPSVGASDPAGTLPVLGAGPPEITGGGDRSLLQPTGVIAGSGASSGSDQPGDGQGATSLFGVNDEGERFVYVIDNSGSMESRDALQFAKNELLRSVEALGEEQRFLVLFYNSELTIIAPHTPQPQMFHGTDAHRLDLSQQIASIEGDGGTDHVLALRESLEYHADVIFFLSDAGNPNLTTSEIEDLTRRNGGASRIHCIEFGDHPEVAREDPSNPMRRLAEANHGRYVYMDVRSFRQ